MKTCVNLFRIPFDSRYYVRLKRIERELRRMGAVVHDFHACDGLAFFYMSDNIYLDDIRRQMKALGIPCTVSRSSYAIYCAVDPRPERFGGVSNG